MGTILVYNNEGGRPYSIVALDSGEHVTLSLDRTGLTIRQHTQAGTNGQVLFAAGPKIVAGICAGLSDRDMPVKDSPLEILAPLVSKLPSAAAVKNAFTDAAAPFA